MYWQGKGTIAKWEIMRQTLLDIKAIFSCDSELA